MGKNIDVRKSPKGDMTKASKAGKLKLHAVGDSFITIQSSKEQFGENNGYVDSLELVFKDGILYREEKFSEIRKTAKKYL